VLYLMVAALRLEIDGRLTFLVRQAVVAGAALAGHVALFMSMWLHARHVLHFTADPERQARRRWRLPLPHFRIPSLGWRRRGSRVVPAEADQEPAKSRRRPRRSASPTPAGASDSDARTKDAGESSSLARARSESPKLRFDRGHESDRGIPAEEPARELAEPPVAEALIADESLPESAIDDQAEADETAEHPTFEQPNLKGLSKKQRRRLMQELRDRERAARRE
jgi:hypothetical protein